MSTWDLDERNKVSFDEEHSKVCIYDGVSFSQFFCKKLTEILLPMTE